MAARKGRVAVLGEDHLDAVGVVWVHDGGDVEVVRTCVTVPAHLAEHTGDVGTALVVRVPVADPGVGEGNVGSPVTFDGDAVDGGEAGLRCEDDVAGGAVLVDELDCVGCCEGEEGRDGEEGACELHFEAFVR